MFFSKKRYILRLINAIKNETGEVTLVDSENVIAYWGHLWSWTFMFENKKVYVINSGYLPSNKWVGVQRRQEMHIDGVEYSPFWSTNLYDELLRTCRNFLRSTKVKLIEEKN